ncbi:transmembrane protein 154 isoform 1-T1 [Menidia menidia]
MIASQPSDFLDGKLSHNGSASGRLRGTMRGRRLKTLLLLLLLGSLTGTAFCQEEEPAEDSEPDDEQSIVNTDDVPETTSPTDPWINPDTSFAEEEDGGSGRIFDIENSTNPYELSSSPGPPEEALDLTIILIPVVLVIMIIIMTVCGIFISRRWNNKLTNEDSTKDDPYLDGSSTEKVPMPMFEEDVPSVLELEMEELDQWMKKDTFQLP